MKTTGIFFAIIFFAFTIITAFQNRKEELRNKPAADMEEAVNNFLKTLDKDLREKAVYTFEDEERFNWHYVPKARQGVPLKKMNPVQKAAARNILRVALSKEGYEKTQKIVFLEDILREVEGRPVGDTHRDSANYLFTVFGTPSKTQPWGWRMEGHHISLNFSSVTNKLISSTPSFWGTNPAVVPSGKYQGMQVLKEEEELARALMSKFDTAQLRKAMIQTDAPGDILTTNSRKADLGNLSGLSYGEMSESQKELMLKILNLYINSYKKEISDGFLKRIKAKDVNRLHFAWAGSLEKGKGHYYRIHGPNVVIEYDNTQSNANHVHTVIRDLENDFGGDILARHYKEKHE